MTPALHLYVQLQDALNDTSGLLRVHLAARVLQDALSEATASYWLHRAETLEAARYRPGVDHPGQASIDELRQRWVDLASAATACRAHAQLLRDNMPEEISNETYEALEEVA